jgi:hypothetical protein
MKTERLVAYEEKVDTDIDLREGEYVSVMATGTVRRNGGAEQEPNSWGMLAMWVGSSKNTLFWNVNGKTFQALLPGRLYLGFKQSLSGARLKLAPGTSIFWSWSGRPRISV